MFKRKKTPYIEYEVNDTFFRKFYNLYVQRSVLNPTIDILVLIAIIITTIGFTVNVIVGLNLGLFIFINTLSGFIILIFVIELMKKYAEAPNKKYFFKNHWLDFILISFLSVYMIFVGFLGIVKLFIFDLLKPLFHEIKEYRVMYKLFKRE